MVLVGCLFGWVVAAVVVVRVAKWCWLVGCLVGWLGGGGGGGGGEADCKGSCGKILVVVVGEVAV